MDAARTACTGPRHSPELKNPAKSAAKTAGERPEAAVNVRNISSRCQERSTGMVWVLVGVKQNQGLIQQGWFGT